MNEGDPTTPAAFFAGSPEGLAIHARVAGITSALGGVEERVTRSQVAFRRRRGFAYLWRPGQYVHSDVPAVLSVALPERLDSPRWKEVVHPSPSTWMHHLEVRHPDEVDDEVAGWLARAWAAAGGQAT